jgi:hypothetical protein
MRKHIPTFALVVLALLVGYWGGKYRSVQAGSPRTFELREYITAPGKYPDLVKRFHDHTLALFEKHGMTNIGYWNATEDPQQGHVFYYMLAYPSREAREKMWKEFSDDPEWHKVKDASEVNGKLVDKVEAVFLEPTDFSPLQ